MKVHVAVWILLLSACRIQAGETPRQTASASQDAPQNAPTQSAGPDASPTQAKIDPAKAADIQKLIEVAGMKAMMNDVLNSMITNVRPSMLKALPPGDYRDKLVDLFFEKFRSKLSIQQFLDMAAAAYDKYLTDEDIKGLTQFYQTPLGQKTLTVLPKLTVELQTEGMQYGQQAGRDSMMEVLSEHPDLAKALQDASH